MTSADDCFQNFITNIIAENGPRLYSYLQSFEKMACSVPLEADLMKLVQKDVDRIRHFEKKHPKEQRLKTRRWLPYLKILFQTLHMKHREDPYGRLRAAISTFVEYDPIFRINPHETNPKSPTRRNWQIPILVYTLKVLRECAVHVSCHIPDEDIQELSRRSRNLILYCQNIDTDVDISMSRFKAIPFIVNAVLIVLISSNQTDQCRSFILAVEAMQKQGSPFLDCATRAQYVIYQFYLGRMRLLERNFKGASSAFLSAFQKLPAQHKNKSITLFYGAISSLLCGTKVNSALLTKYKLSPLIHLTQAVESSNYAAFRTFTEDNRDMLIERGVYTLIPHLMTELNVCAMQRCYALSKKIQSVDASRLPVSCICEFMVTMGALPEVSSEDVSMDMIAGILASKRAMGYLARAHKTVVLSKANPFPSPT